MKFRIAEKFRLEIHWEKAIYEKDSIAKLEGCYLSGPAIKEVLQMNENDGIVLDFAIQYVVFVKYYYVAKLVWQGVKHDVDKIYLSNVTLSNRYLNSVPKLNDNDYIVIDTKDHENAKHQMNLSYKSYLIKSDGELYDFVGSK
jgi:hypothetical protein